MSARGEFESLLTENITSLHAEHLPRTTGSDSSDRITRRGFSVCSVSRSNLNDHKSLVTGLSIRVRPPILDRSSLVQVAEATHKSGALGRRALGDLSR